MTPIYGMFVVVVMIWLLGFVSGGVALWSALRKNQTFTLTMAAAVFALLCAIVGLTNYTITYSRTVNGEGWSVRSTWFFFLPLVLAMAAFTVGLLNRTKSHAFEQGSDSKV